MMSQPSNRKTKKRGIDMVEQSYDIHDYVDASNTGQGYQKIKRIRELAAFDIIETNAVLPGGSQTEIGNDLATHAMRPQIPVDLNSSSRLLANRVILRPRHTREFDLRAAACAEYAFSSMCARNDRRLFCPGTELSYPKRVQALAKLPVELWELVFDNLDCRDIRSMRQVCKSLGVIGLAFLFKPFVLRADRRDLERLESVIQYTKLTDRIKSLRFEIGVADIPHTVLHLSPMLQFQHNYGIRKAKRKNREFDIEYMQRAKAETIDELATWSNRFAEARQDYSNHRRLVAMFKNLPWLESVSMAYRSTQWTNRRLVRTYLSSHDPYLFPRICSEFDSILHAVKFSRTKIKKLSHDRLPVSYFVVPQALQRPRALTLVDLTSLHLTFIASKTPLRVFWKGLGIFLQCLPHLRYLNLGFHPLPRDDRISAAWCNTDTPQDWYVPLWHILDNTKRWKYLSTLRLDGMLLCEHGLWELLHLHATTLISFGLSNIGLWSGSFSSLLLSVRSHLKLQEFKIGGRIRSFHCRSEFWVLPAIHDSNKMSNYDYIVYQAIRDWEIGYRTYFGCWQSACSSYNATRAICKCQRLARSLERFVLGLEAWPTDTKVRVYDFPCRADRLDHSDACTGCNIDLDTLKASWKYSDPTPGEYLWESPKHGPAFETDVMGDEIVESYNSAGYDRFGYDYRGYDADGVHHSDVTHTSYGHPGITSATVFREVLKGVLSKVDRFKERHPIHVARRNIFRLEIANLKDLGWEKKAKDILQYLEKAKSAADQDQDDLETTYEEMDID